MKYQTLLTLVLAADQVAARSVSFTNMEDAAARADIAQIEAERAEGADERALERRHPSAFGPSEDINKRSEASRSSFLNNIFTKIGLNDAQAAEAQAAVDQKMQLNVHERSEASSSSFLNNIFAKIGLNDAEAAQAQVAVNQQLQASVMKAKEQVAAGGNTISKREAEAEPASNFLSGLLVKIGLTGEEKDVVQATVEQQMADGKENVKNMVAAAQMSSAEQKRSDEANVPLRQGADGQIEIPVEVSEKFMDLIKKDDKKVEQYNLVEELKAWKRAPGTKAAYAELARQNEAMEESLGKRHALCK